MRERTNKLFIFEGNGISTVRHFFSTSPREKKRKEKEKKER